MKIKDEYLFGIRYWCSKVVVYRRSRDIDELLKDDLSFDAICFCLINISEISKNISKESKEIFSLDYSRLENLSKDVLYNNEYINIELFDEITKDFLPSIFNTLKDIEYSE